MPPNPLATKIQVHVSPSFMAQRRIGQGMATARRTSRWKGQKINAPHVSTLQGNCFHRIRRTATSKTTFFCLSLSFSPFLLLYHESNPSSPLSYKRRGRGHIWGGDRAIQRSNDLAIKQQQLEPIETTSPPPLTRDLGPDPSLESLYPCYEHPGARQHEPQRNPLDVGLFMPEPVYILVSALYTIKA
jgi:hypothetical protein